MVIKVDNRNISLLGGGLPTSGSKCYDRCLFIFGEGWTGLTKTAVFWQNKDERYEMLLDEADSCDVPWEAQQTDGFMFVGVIGRNFDTVLPSKILICPVSEGTKAGSAEHQATQSLYEQMVYSFAHSLSEAQTLTAKAEQEASRSEHGAIRAELEASRASQEADRAEQVAVSTPYIGENGNWFIWNSEANAYVDSGASSLGKESKGDMQTSVYDADGDGTVDNCASLGGIPASSYATTNYVASYVASYVSGAITSALEASY